jgi:hypothetical protein
MQAILSDSILDEWKIIRRQLLEQVIWPACPNLRLTLAANLLAPRLVGRASALFMKPAPEEEQSEAPPRPPPSHGGRVVNEALGSRGTSSETPRRKMQQNEIFG